MVRQVVAVVLVFAGAVAVAGCSSEVQGDVDGEKVPALLSSFFIQRKADAVDNDGQLATLFTVGGTALSVLDGCNQAAKAQENFNQAFKTQTEDLIDAAGDADAVKRASEDFADAVVEYEVQNLPTDFWSASVSLAGFDKKKLDGGGADIDFKEPADKPDFTGVVTVCRINDHPEKKRLDDGSFVIDRHQSCFAGVKGTVDVNEYTEDKTLEIVGDVDFSVSDGGAVDPDHDDGAATVKVQGGWCEDLENALDDFDKLVEDRANP